MIPYSPAFYILYLAAGVSDIRHKEFVSVHSMLNKATGGLLFVFSLTLTFIDLRYSATVVCVVATVAAIQEGYLIKKKNSFLTDHFGYTLHDVLHIINIR